METTEVRILTTFHRFVTADDGKEVRQDFVEGATYQVDAETADLWCDVKGLAVRVEV
jgi:hypothetical protein